jgi:uncharacterized protein with HEPN domain
VKDDLVYLRHIDEAITRILAFTSAGESAKKVSAATRAAHPDIPWKSMAGLRDRIVHDYFGISLEIVWDVVKNHLPVLQKQIARLLL